MIFKKKLNSPFFLGAGVENTLLRISSHRTLFFPSFPICFSPPLTFLGKKAPKKSGGLFWLSPGKQAPTWQPPSSPKMGPFSLCFLKFIGKIFLILPSLPQESRNLWGLFLSESNRFIFSPKRVFLDDFWGESRPFNPRYKMGPLASFSFFFCVVYPQKNPRGHCRPVSCVGP